MKKMIHSFLLGSIICSHAIAMEVPKTHLLVIPGQNGIGGDNVTRVLPHFAQNQDLIHLVETPLVIPDLGQGRCQNYLQQKINSLNLNKDDKIILHGSSQGTATVLNYASKHPEQIGALILEAVLLSGNSAVYHTVENLMLPGATSLPGSYHWMPYAAKVQYPNYSPAGEQPICNVDKLPDTLPIIIIHHDKDPQLSHKDAQALYAHLKQKNNTVYFISTTSEWFGHVNLLDTKKHKSEIETINNILKQNNLLPSNPNEQLSVNSDTYQPEPQQEWINHFNDLLHKENKFKIIDPCIKGVVLVLLLYKFSILQAIFNAVLS